MGTAYFQMLHTKPSRPSSNGVNHKGQYSLGKESKGVYTPYNSNESTSNKQEYNTDNYNTEEAALEAVRKNGLELRKIKNQTKEICLAAVKENGNALEYVSKYNRTPEICMIAVKSYGMTLKDVINQTPDICREAVKQNGDALIYVKNQFMTAELCNIALSHGKLYYKTYMRILKYDSRFLDAILQVDETFAQHMQRENPDLLYDIMQQQETPEERKGLAGWVKNKVKYRITARIMSGREVIGYATEDNRGNKLNLTKEQVCFLAGSDQVVNCIAVLTQDDITLSGKGCELSALPTIQYKQSFEI